MAGFISELKTDPRNTHKSELGVATLPELPHRGDIVSFETTGDVAGAPDMQVLIRIGEEERKARLHKVRVLLGELIKEKQRANQGNLRKTLHEESQDRAPFHLSG